MSDWTSGYVSDIGYTYGYYTELNPLRAKLALLQQGLACPEFKTACELGFGQGVSISIHAAASSTDWYGNDFNPEHAGFAQSLADVVGSKINLSDESFLEFSTRSDMPKFDYIGLHGIWSWISDENRSIIVEFIRHRLNVGGVVYLSYNTLPGWASFAPMRHLLSLHARVQGSSGQGVVGNIDGAFEFVQEIIATNPIFSKANPLLADRLIKVKNQNKNYVAHEYFNKDWEPMHFASMMNWLAPAKLQFACSANPLDGIDNLNLSPDQQNLLKNIGDMTLRETSRDFIVNQQFRRDYWIRGARRIDAIEQHDELRRLRVVLVVPASEISLKIKGVVGEAEMNEAVYNPILKLLGDYKARKIGYLEEQLLSEGISLAQIVQSVMVLSGAGYLAAAQEDDIAFKARARTEKLNIYLMQKARGSQNVTHLASPLTGGGIPVSRFCQLFLASYLQGKKTPEDWVQAVWDFLHLSGQRLVKDGKELLSPDENRAELMGQAVYFSQKRLPIMKALMIV